MSLSLALARTCMRDKIPVHIAEHSRFIKQQVWAIQQGALPYCLISHIKERRSRDSWCGVQWYNTDGDFVTANDYPVSDLKLYQPENQIAYQTLHDLDYFV